MKNLKNFLASYFFSFLFVFVAVNIFIFSNENAWVLMALIAVPFAIIVLIIASLISMIGELEKKVEELSGDNKREDYEV